MKSIVYVLLLFLLGNNFASNAQSCDSMTVCDCATKDLSPAGVMLGHEHGKGSWKVSYRYMTMMMKDKLSGNVSVDDNTVYNNYLMSPQTMQMDMHMVMGMYGFTNRLSAMVMLNYNVNTMSMTALPGATMMMDGVPMVMSEYSANMTTTSSGLGDTKLYAVYALVNKNVHHVLLSEGFNIPTGSIKVNGKADDMMYPHTRMPYMMQLGSGSFDFMPGITYLLKQGKLSASVQVTSVLRPFNNSLNYHLGNELNGTVWVAYKWFPWMSTSVRVEENVVGKISGKDILLTENMEPAAFSRNYGGQCTTAFAGINFYINKTFMKNNKFTVEYGLPLYQKVNGIQLSQQSSVTAGWLISF